MLERIKDALAIIRECLFGGLVGFLPGLLFAALVYIFFSILGIKHMVNEIMLFAYGGACGGYWVGKFKARN
jgi:hypothetical protein